jgi:hypothetical protein
MRKYSVGAVHLNGVRDGFQSFGTELFSLPCEKVVFISHGKNWGIRAGLLPGSHVLRQVELTEMLLNKGSSQGKQHREFPLRTQLQQTVEKC